MTCRNPNCVFEHKIFPQHFNESDKNILIRFEKENDVFSFLPYIANKLKNATSLSKPVSESASNSLPEPKKSKKDKDTSAEVKVETSGTTE